MSLDGVFKVAGALVTVAMVTTIVSNKNSASVFKAIGSSFSNVLLAAQGKG